MSAEKFVAPTMKEALAKVKEALGEDAIILRSERVKSGGALNFLRQEVMEITATRAEDINDDLQTGPEFAETLDNTVIKQQDNTLTPRQRFEITLLKDEIKNLRDDLSQIGKHIKYKDLPNLPTELTRYWEAAKSAGVDSNWATDVAQDALIHLGPEELISAQAIEGFLIQRLSRSVQAAPINTVKRRSSYKIAFVGAPGAGKTTTLQKLATDPVAYGKRKVGLLSTDTQRMAAIDQIKAYARIAGTPLEVVFQPQFIGESLSRLQSCEIVLIDTAGVSPHDMNRLTELGAFMSAVDPDEVHLVLNATIRDDELKLTCERYREVGVTHISFTRMDETLHNGYLLNVAKSAQKPVAWMGTGQNFVGGVERFRPDMLRDWIAPQNDAVQASYPMMRASEKLA